MSETIGTNGAGAPVTAPPPGAVVLTEAILARTSREWVKLPQLTWKVGRLTTIELLADGYLTPVGAWTEAERALALTALGAEAEGEDVDAKLLEGRASQIRAVGVWVEIGMIGYTDFMAALPQVPGSDTWPKDPTLRSERFQQWLDSLSAEAKGRFAQDSVDAHFEVLALGLLTPKLTARQARRFADDAIYLVEAIKKLSGLPGVEPPAPAKTAGAATPASEVPAAS